MNHKDIKKLLNRYIDNENQKGCFLIKGSWGVGKTHFINEYANSYAKSSTKFIKISLFNKNDISQITSEINSNLIGFGKKFLKTLIKIPKGISVFSVSLNLDFAVLMSEKSPLERKKLSNEKIVFIFDDSERTNINLKDALGYINNINENYGFKVIALANTNKFENDENIFNKYKEKVFYTEVIFGDSFKEIAHDIIANSKVKSNENQIIELFFKEKHENLRTLIFAIQKIEQILEYFETNKTNLDEYVLRSLTGKIIECSIEKAEPSTKETEKEKHVKEFAAALRKSGYNMDFLMPFVNNEDYSFDEITERVREIQQYAADNKDNPLPNLKDKWIYLNDDEYQEMTARTREWTRDNKIPVAEYYDILKIITTDFFTKKMKMF